MLYGESSLNPLTLDELTLVEELMKGAFKIQNAKEAKVKNKAATKKKKRKTYDIETVDRVVT